DSSIVFCKHQLLDRRVAVTTDSRRQAMEDVQHGAVEHEETEDLPLRVALDQQLPTEAGRRQYGAPELGRFLNLAGHAVAPAAARRLHYARTRASRQERSRDTCLLRLERTMLGNRQAGGREDVVDGGLVSGELDRGRGVQLSTLALHRRDGGTAADLQMATLELSH